MSISNPTNNQLLKYDTATSKWINATVSTGATALSALTTDVNITTPVNGTLLIYDSTSSKWLNSDSIPDNLFFLYDDGYYKTISISIESNNCWTNTYNNNT